MKFTTSENNSLGRRTIKDFTNVLIIFEISLHWEVGLLDES